MAGKKDINQLLEEMQVHIDNTLALSIDSASVVWSPDRRSHQVELWGDWDVQDRRPLLSKYPRGHVHLHTVPNEGYAANDQGQAILGGLFVSEAFKEVTAVLLLPPADFQAMFAVFSLPREVRAAARVVITVFGGLKDWNESGVLDIAEATIRIGDVRPYDSEAKPVKPDLR